MKTLCFNASVLKNSSENLGWFEQSNPNSKYLNNMKVTNQQNSIFLSLKTKKESKKEIES